MKIETCKDTDFWGKLDVAGVITIASRLKRLSDLFYQQAQEVYDSRSRAFKTSWFSVLATIQAEGEVDFKTLASKNNVSTSAISQVMRELEKLEYVNVKQGLDKRSRFIELTDEGEKVLTRIIPDLTDIESILNNLLGDEAKSLLAILEKTESALRNKSFYDLLEVGIDEYQDQFKDDFVKLNEDWLYKDFKKEEIDEIFFSDPKKLTYDNGGKIFLAFHKNKVVGTIALIPKENGELEISKLTTKEDLRERGVAQKLLNRAMLFAKSNSYKELVVPTNTILKEANNFYLKNEFTQSDFVDPRYSRVNTIFKKEIN